MNHEQRQQRRRAVAWYYDAPLSEVPAYVSRQHRKIIAQLETVIENDQLAELLPASKDDYRREVIERTKRFLGGEAITAIARDVPTAPDGLKASIQYTLRRLNLHKEQK